MTPEPILESKTVTINTEPTGLEQSFFLDGEQVDFTPGMTIMQAAVRPDTISLTYAGTRIFLHMDRASCAQSKLESE